jgi:hypothetical protein
MLIEGASGSTDEFLSSTLPLATDRYGIELVVLAVREADSLLSTALHYARSLEVGAMAGSPSATPTTRLTTAGPARLAPGRDTCPRRTRRAVDHGHRAGPDAARQLQLPTPRPAARPRLPARPGVAREGGVELRERLRVGAARPSTRPESAGTLETAADTLVELVSALARRHEHRERTADRPLDSPPRARWIDGEQHTRNRWRSLVTARREYLRNAR